MKVNGVRKRCRVVKNNIQGAGAGGGRYSEKHAAGTVRIIYGPAMPGNGPVPSGPNSISCTVNQHTYTGAVESPSQNFKIVFFM